MSAGAILGGLGIGAGVGASTVALAPFNAANTFMGSAFFGYGMILGERYMYQADWPKIQARLEHGEKIENIIQEYTGTFSAVVMKEAKIIFESVTQQFMKYIEERISGDIPPVTITTEGGTGEIPEPFVDTGGSTSIKQDETGDVTTSFTHYSFTVPKTDHTPSYPIHVPITEKGRAMNRIVTLQNRINLANKNGTFTGTYSAGRIYYWVVVELNLWVKLYPQLWKDASSAFKY